MSKTNTVNETHAIRHLMDLLSVEGLSGREGDVGARREEEAARRRLQERLDDARPGPPADSGDYEIGNLIVKLPGTRKGDRILFMGHMDTVPLCRGAVPLRRGNRIVSKGKTGSGRRQSHGRWRAW